MNSTRSTDPFRCLDEASVGKVGIVRRRAVPPMAETAKNQKNPIAGFLDTEELERLGLAPDAKFNLKVFSIRVTSGSASWCAHL